MWTIEKKFELSEPTAGSFLCERFAMIMEFILIVIPVIFLIAKVMEWSGDYLVLVFFLTTAVVKIFLSYIYPLVIMPMTSSTEDLPGYADKLRPFISKISEKAEFNPEVLLLEKSMETDVHVNAATYFGKIKLGEPLFKGHGQWPAEIIAVICHELGHYYLSHLLK